MDKKENNKMDEHDALRMWGKLLPMLNAKKSAFFVGEALGHKESLWNETLGISDVFIHGW